MGQGGAFHDARPDKFEERLKADPFVVRIVSHGAGLVLNPLGRPPPCPTHALVEPHIEEGLDGLDWEQLEGGVIQEATPQHRTLLTPEKVNFRGAPEARAASQVEP